MLRPVTTPPQEIRSIDPSAVIDDLGATMDGIFKTLMNTTAMSPLAVAALHDAGGVAQLLPLLHSTNTAVQTYAATILASCATARAPNIDRDVAISVAAATSPARGSGGAAVVKGSKKSGGAGPSEGRGGLPDISDARGMLHSLR